MNSEVKLLDPHQVEAYQSSPEEEIKVMTNISSSGISKLDAAARQRVLNWAASIFMPREKFTFVTSGSQQNDDDNDNIKNTSSFNDLHDLLEQVTISSKLENALVIAYWFQVCQGQEDFSAQQINDQLKDIGNPLANITDSLSSLISQNFVRQIEKSGKTKQARKKYRLTTLGTKKVEQLLNTPKS